MPFIARTGERPGNSRFLIGQFALFGVLLGPRLLSARDPALSWLLAIFGLAARRAEVQGGAQFA